MAKNALNLRLPDAQKRLDLPMQTRLAAVQPSSLNVESRTIDLVWSTGAKVRRFDYWEGRYYDEELSLDPAHVDLSRLNAGANLLNSHGQYDLSDVLGVVERAWIEDGQGLATVRFSSRAEVEPIFADVKTGIIRNVSVGYWVRKYEVTREDGKVDVYRAVDWQPGEISLVSVPADAGAGTRAASRDATAPCHLAIAAREAAPDTAALEMMRRRLQVAGLS